MRIHHNIVSVQPLGTRFHWVRRIEGKGSFISRESYADELEAHLAAATIAQCHRLPLQATPEMRRRLIAYWTELGRQLHLAGEPIERCANQYQRQGYLQAQAEQAELEAFWDELLRRPTAVELEAEAV